MYLKSLYVNIAHFLPQLFLKHTKDVLFEFFPYSVFGSWYSSNI